jgi:hypothetical protein
VDLSEYLSGRWLKSVRWITSDYVGDRGDVPLDRTVSQLARGPDLAWFLREARFGTPKRGYV